MTPTHREYVQRINRVMDYVERHLDEPLPLERLAEVATFSKYHFHRIFFAQVGETPGQFVQRLRLEKAAVLLVSNRERPVTDVGFDVGFTDMAAFSRAFARLHGLSPTAYRAERSNLGTANRKQGTEPRRSIAYPSDQQESTRRNTMEVSGTKPVAASSVTVAERSETTVAYVRHTGPYMGDEALFARLFRELHAWAEPRGLVQRGETEEIVIYHDDPDTVPEEKLRVSCGISVPPETEVGGTVGKLTLDAGTYAIARFEVDATEFGGAWVWLYGEWLPGSGYQPDDRLCFERYPDEEPARQADEETRVFVVDICIPVKPL